MNIFVHEKDGMIKIEALVSNTDAAKQKLLETLTNALTGEDGKVTPPFTQLPKTGRKMCDGCHYMKYPCIFPSCEHHEGNKSKPTPPVLVERKPFDAPNAEVNTLEHGDEANLNSFPNKCRVKAKHKEWEIKDKAGNFKKIAYGHIQLDNDTISQDVLIAISAVIESRERLGKELEELYVSKNKMQDNYKDYIIWAGKLKMLLNQPKATHGCGHCFPAGWFIKRDKIIDTPIGGK